MKTNTTISVLQALRSGTTITVRLPTSIYSTETVQEAIADARTVCEASIVEELSTTSVTVVAADGAGNTLSALCDSLLRRALSQRGVEV